jgi:hypothetical protein
MLSVMSEQFSIFSIALQSGLEVECRSVVSSITGAHIAGLPLQRGEEHTVVALQKLPARIQRHFGDAPHVVLEPELRPHSAAWLSAPKVEHMALLFAPSRMQSLVVVWYEPAGEPLMSTENRKRIEHLDWDSLAKNCEAATT